MFLSLPVPACLPCSEYLEKNYAETSGKDTLKLALKALVEVVEGSSKNIEVAVVEKEGALRFLTGAVGCAELQGGLAAVWTGGEHLYSRERKSRCLACPSCSCGRGERMPARCSLDPAAPAAPAPLQMRRWMPW